MGSRDTAIGPLAVDDVVLDRYRVVEHVATGGHSEVYRGRDERLSRPVCIKMFSKFPDDPGVWRTAYEHFVQEAFALSKLTHPNTLRIYDFGHMPGRDGDDGGTPIQISEFMGGGTLSQLVRDRGGLPAHEAVRIAAALCEALDEAHDVGLVHRDIKPQNILFNSLGAARVAKLADFGIAKWRDDARVSVDFSERAGDTQVVAGVKMAMYSPSWAAPEQLTGKVIGPPADIYSLGALVVFMLTGRAMFAEEDVQRGYRKRRRVDEVLRELLAPRELPPEAIAVLAHALAFAPEDRPHRASDFAHDLAQAFEPRTTELSRPSERSSERSAERSAERGAGPDRSDRRAGADRSERGAPRPPSWPEVETRADSPRGIAAERPPSSISLSAMLANGRATPDAAQLPPPPDTPARPIAAVPRTAPEHESRPALAIPPVAAVSAASPSPSPSPTGSPSASGFPTPVQAAPPSGNAQTTTERHALPRHVAPAGPASNRRTGDRQLCFTPTRDGVVDLAVASARIRVTVMPEIDGKRPIHVKGLSCFVLRRGGRPSAAVLIDRDGDVDMVSGRSQVIASARLSRGSPAAGHTVFHVGAEAIAVSLDDCPDPIAFDFGPGAECHIIFTAPRSERTRRSTRSNESP